MRITNINYDIENEENDYTAEIRAEKMREIANELRAARDKAQQVYEPAIQEIGWKKVQVFLENIETQIRPLLYALKEISEAEGRTGRFGIRVNVPDKMLSTWFLYADSDGKIDVLAKESHELNAKEFPSYWVKEHGEPRGNYTANIFYGEEGIVANTDFAQVLKAFDSAIEEKYNVELDNIRQKQAYYENSFKKIAEIDKDVSLDSVIKNAVSRAAQSAGKGISIQKDFIKD